MDKGKYFQVILDDVDKVQSDLKLMDAFSDDAGEQMKIACEVDVLGQRPGLRCCRQQGQHRGCRFREHPPRRGWHPLLRGEGCGRRWRRFAGGCAQGHRGAHR
jgi:hypothetical protein